MGMTQAAAGGPFGPHLGTTGAAPSHQQKRQKRQPRNPYSRACRHERDAIRSVVAQAEAATLQKAGQTRSDALRQCEGGSVLFDRGGGGRPVVPVVSISTGRVVARSYHCDHRLCPWCARQRSAGHARVLTEAVRVTFKSRRCRRCEYVTTDATCPRCENARTAGQSIPWPLSLATDARPAFITLTQQDVPGESLRDAMRRLLDRWGRFRRHELFGGKKGRDASGATHWVVAPKVRGGWRSIEVTRNKVTGAWHCHIHVVADLDKSAGQRGTDHRPWEQDDAIRVWRECASVDDLRAWSDVRGGYHGPAREGGINLQWLKKTVAEGTKYITKPAAVVYWPHAALVELVAWMRGRRLLQAFGSLYGTKLRETETASEGEVDGCEEVANSATGEVIPVTECHWQSTAAAHEAARALNAAEWELERPWAGGRQGTVMVH